MKVYKIITKITVVLMIVLLSLISFIGIFETKGFKLNNLIKDYSLSMELKGSKIIVLDTDNSSETKTYDSEGNLVETKEEGVEYTEENGYTTVEEKANSEDTLTKNNFEKVKLILEKRLKKLGVEQYIIKQDITTGNTTIEIPNTDSSDEIVSFLAQTGNFKIIDSETEEVLMDKSSIKDVNVQYYPQQDNNVLVALLISLNKNGQEKFKELSNIYISAVENVVNEETGETEQKTVEKNVKVNIDDTTLLEMYFQKDLGAGYIIWLDAEKGIITIPLGRAEEQTEIQENIKKAQGLKTILDTDIIPVKYNSSVDVVSGQIETREINIVVYTSIAIFLIIIIILTIKYKIKGLSVAILEVGYIAILLLLVRTTNVTIAVSGILGIILASLLNILFLVKLLKNKDKSGWKNLKYVIPKFTMNIIPVIIISIIFTFGTVLGLSSLGMTLFWGIMLIYLYNLSFTNILL